MLEEFKVQGAATLRADPQGKRLLVFGTLPNGRLLCVQDGETQAQEYDLNDLYVFPTGPVDQPPQKV
jgi:hypothetical protein